MKETFLVKQCLDYLALKRLFHWRNNSGALVTEKRHFVRFGAVGSPDIFILKDGVLIGVECKVGRNKQSEHQKAFQKAMEANGGRYWLIYNVEDLILKLI